MNRRRFLNWTIRAGWASLASSLAPCISALNVIAGKRRLNCQWQQRKHGLFIGDLNEGNSAPLSFMELYVNGERQILARFPDADPSGRSNYVAAVRFLPDGLILPDFDEDSRNLLAIQFDPATFTSKRWGNPEEAVLCIRNSGGDLRFPIHAVDYDQSLIWFSPLQNKSKLDLSAAPEFYVENVYEELTAPHEWYLNRQLSYLFYRPPDDVVMSIAVFEAA